MFNHLKLPRIIRNHLLTIAYIVNSAFLLLSISIFQASQNANDKQFHANDDRLEQTALQNCQDINRVKTEVVDGFKGAILAVSPQSADRLEPFISEYRSRLLLVNCEERVR